MSPLCVPDLASRAQLWCSLDKMVHLGMRRLTQLSGTWLTWMQTGDVKMDDDNDDSDNDSTFAMVSLHFLCIHPNVLPLPPFFPVFGRSGKPLGIGLLVSLSSQTMAFQIPGPVLVLGAAMFEFRLLPGYLRVRPMIPDP